MILFVAIIFGFVVGVIVTTIVRSNPDPFHHVTIFGPDEDDERWLN